MDTNKPPNSVPAPQGDIPGVAPETTPVPSPSPSSSRSKVLLLGVCAIVAVVVIVLALILSGALSPTSSGGTGVTFRSAWSAANKTTSEASGADWNLTLAAGYDSPASFSIGLSNLTESCAVTQVGITPVPTSLSIPAFSGKLDSGDAPFWLFAYEQNSTGDILLVEVANGQPQPIGVVASSCAGLGLVTMPITGSLLDSSTAAKIAAAHGGAAYVTAHPSAFLEMGIVGGLPGEMLPGIGALWSFEYSPCNPFGGENPTGNQSAFIIEMSAVNGSVFVALNTTATCTGPNSTMDLATSFGFGTAFLQRPASSTPGECAAYDYCYEISIALAAEGLTANDLELELTTATGSFVPIVNFYIDGATSTQGYLSAVPGENPAIAWFSGSGTFEPDSPLTSSDTIWIDVSATTNPVGQGYQLTAIGVNAFSGQVLTTLP
jgi:hypothetical protein